MGEGADYARDKEEKRRDDSAFHDLGRCEGYPECWACACEVHAKGKCENDPSLCIVCAFADD